MIRILFFNSEGKWFSTAIVPVMFESDFSIAQNIRNEIRAHYERFGILGGCVITRNNQDLTKYYRGIMTEYNLSIGE
jgi:hypothetical protein